MGELDPSEPQHRSGRIGSALRGELVYLLPAILLIALLFGRTLICDEQLAFRDAGHFYYPLFEQQFQEWRGGRVPLWNPHENGGEPLAANPTASVFYPGKILLALLPFPLAYKTYLVGHLLLAAGNAYAAARLFGLGRAGASMASLGYAGSGFVLFQVYNIVFLVGAAWLPWGMLASYRLLDRQTIGWVGVAGASLALSILGGDPQTAQMILVLALPLALFRALSWPRATLLMLALLGLGWGIVHGSAPLAESLAQAGSLQDWVQALSSASVTVLTSALEQGRQGDFLGWSWVAGSLLILGGGWIRWRRSLPWKGFALLGLAAALAVGLSAIQVLPTLEFTARSGRASPDVPAETVAFSLHPARLVEAAWSMAWGPMLPTHGRWFPWAAAERSVWVPNFYAGLCPLLLGIASVRLWKGEPLDRWLTWIAVGTLLLSFGKFGDFRWLWDSSLSDVVHPLDAGRGTRLHGESTGLYWLAERTIPGFAQFRYPSKLFVFVAWGWSLLAGRSLDRVLVEGVGRRLYLIAGLAGAVLIPAPLLASFAYAPLRSLIEKTAIPAGSYGPFQLDTALTQLYLALGWGMVGMSIILLLLVTVAYRPARGFRLGEVLLGLTLVDLAIAHHAIALTAPQETFDQPPEAIARIQAYHQEHHPGELFRVHRTRLFEPIRFLQNSSPKRVEEQVAWEHKTAQPKYAITHGIDYTKTEGTMNLYDIDFFFAPWVVSAPPMVRSASGRGVERIVYYPRVGYDLWNTRYFVLPKQTILDHVERGSLTLLSSQRGEPLPVVESWSAETDDCIILENVDAMPRAWIVHEVEILPPISNLRRAPRTDRMERLLYRSLDGGIPLWEGQPHGDYPIRTRAMVEPETDEARLPLEELTPIRSANPPADSVRFTRYESDRVELRVSLSSAGLLVLADSIFPGWEATVDGASRPIVRTNRAMRGVHLLAGDHVVEFRYRPGTIWLGLIVSAGSILLLTIGVLYGARSTSRRFKE
jgi:hypothetical protein